ncbi:hypothetical protein [Streptomyces shenzhenensis]|uniref:hypothetical protein n=1 Tax=Streptomyces shenzhenensis TaxID=943815 RepID=UPI003695AF60
MTAPAARAPSAGPDRRGTASGRARTRDHIGADAREDTGAGRIVRRARVNARSGSASSWNTLSARQPSRAASDGGGRRVSAIRKSAPGHRSARDGDHPLPRVDAEQVVREEAQFTGVGQPGRRRLAARAGRPRTGPPALLRTDATPGGAV